MVITAKCHGPAPLGVGTMTAKVPTTNITSPADRPKCAEKSKAKKAARKALKTAGPIYSGGIPIYIDADTREELELKKLNELLINLIKGIVIFKRKCYNDKRIKIFYFYEVEHGCKL